MHLYVGAKPGFIDIEDKTLHIDIGSLEKILKIESKRKKIKVVVPVHFMGTVMDIAAVRRICSKYGIKVVEDAAHALGAKYRCGNKWFKVGSCQHSDITIFSFHPIKHITTGEGGAILTNSRQLYERALSLRHHGIKRKGLVASRLLQRAKNNLWFYDIPEIGFNFRITDFQCALGISQLTKLDRVVRIRRNIVRKYNEVFSKIQQVKVPYELENTYASYHIYVIRVPADKRDLLYKYLRDRHIYTQINYIPIHLFSYYQSVLGYKDGDFPVAENYFKECLTLPLYPDLSDLDLQRIIKAVKSFLNK